MKCVAKENEIANERKPISELNAHLNFKIANSKCGKHKWGIENRIGYWWPFECENERRRMLHIIYFKKYSMP